MRCNPSAKPHKHAEMLPVQRAPVLRVRQHGEERGHVQAKLPRPGLRRRALVPVVPRGLRRQLQRALRQACAGHKPEAASEGHTSIAHSLQGKPHSYYHTRQTEDLALACMRLMSTLAGQGLPTIKALLCAYKSPGRASTHDTI